MYRRKSELLEGTENVKKSKFINNNTLEIEYKDGTKAIRFHSTDIVTIKDGIYTLNSGGWRTRTTKERMADELIKIDRSIYQEKSVWYISGNWKNKDKKTVVYFDGIQFDKNGKCINPKDSEKVEAKTAKMIKKINSFVSLLSKENLPRPNGGDCWVCSMGIGESNSCLEQHIKEKYIHGSLLVNAMEYSGYSNQQIAIHYHMELVDTFKRSLRKYLKFHLLN